MFEQNALAAAKKQGPPFEHFFSPETNPRLSGFVYWFACDENAARPARALEYSYQTGFGKSSRAFTYTILAWPAVSSPARKVPRPRFYLARLSRWQRRKNRAHEIRLGEFSQLSTGWAGLGDASTARRFLNPAVCELLTRSPRGEAWSIGTDWTCLIYMHALDAKTIDRFLAHGEAIRAAAGA